MVDLNLGDWRDTDRLPNVDCIITDPPYSNVTHEGFLSSAGGGIGGDIRYRPIAPSYCQTFVESWLPHVGGWWVIFGDTITYQWWRSALADQGLYTFPPVVWVKRGAAPRFSGDGPASQCEYVTVARPKGSRFAGGWSLPGWYVDTTVQSRGSVDQSASVVGRKPLSLMRAIIRDYSRPGWTIADPHAGSGTTLIAARQEGRDCVGWEMDPETHAIAQSRLDAPYTPDLFVAK